MPTNSNNVDLDWTAEDFKLISTTNSYYSYYDLKMKNGLVIAFICNHCPYVKDIINRIVIDFNYLKKINVGVVAIMSNDTVNYPEDSFENMKNFASDNKFNFPYLYDDEQSVAKTYHAICTPDFFCFDSNDKLFYRGRLDNLKYKESNEKERCAELVYAFEKKINHNVVVKNQVNSMGCSIKWK